MVMPGTVASTSIEAVTPPHYPYRQGRGGVLPDLRIIRTGTAAGTKHENGMD